MDFNSNMVRLRVHFAKKERLVLAFQFQYGAIKSSTKLVAEATYRNFNSNMVRLRGWSLKGISLR